MSHVVKNAASLARTPLRRDALSLIEAAYAAIDTEHVILSSVKVINGKLHINPTYNLDHEREHVIDLNHFDRVYVVGCGKVACTAAHAIEHALQGYITEGAVVGMTSNACDIITTYEGSHPLPSSVNFRAAEHMMSIGEKLTEKVLVIAIVGGGGSAMLCSDEGECDQGQELYRAFLGTGGTIEELNTVRKHISPLKGGGLAKKLFPATVVSLVFSDVPGGNPAIVASGPTYKDTSTVADAQAIIDRYKLGTFTLTETPKESVFFDKVTNILLVSNETATHAMAHRARTLGYEARMPQCDPYAKSATVVSCLMGASHTRSVVLFGGEPRLAVPLSGGNGGRCSHTALQALSHIEKGHLFGAFASDGHDNSRFAGALVDETTLDRIEHEKLSIQYHLDNHDSNTLLKSTDDLIETGPIEANVSDLFFLLTP